MLNNWHRETCDCCLLLRAQRNCPPNGTRRSFKSARSGMSMTRKHEGECAATVPPSAPSQRVRSQHINMAPTLAALVAGSTKTVAYVVRKLHLSAVRRGCPLMQPPPDRLAPYPLVELFQNACALCWRQCGLFSDRLDSFTWPRLRQRFFISLTPSAGQSAM